MLGCVSSKRHPQYSYIEDQNNVLEKVDAFVGWTSFEDTFRCGTKIVFEINDCARRCEPFYCESPCSDWKESVVTVENCTEESVTFMSKGKPWFSVEKSQYFDFNPVRGWLGLPKNGKAQKPGEDNGKDYVTLLKAEPESFQLKSGDHLDSLRVHVIYHYWVREVGDFNHSKQSMVVGRTQETGGMFLEHNFEENSKPVSRVVSLTIPERKQH